MTILESQTPEEHAAILNLCSRFGGEFMTPDITTGEYCEIENRHGESYFIPGWAYSAADIGDDETVTNHRGILLRLSASGYLDCTEWEPCDNWQEVIARLTEWSEEISTN